MLQRRAKISPNFSMASMTDVIFLLLIFFMITSTVVSPNAIKVLLPQGKQQTSAKPLTRVIIDKDLNFYAAFGNDKEQAISLEELTPFLQSCAAKEPEMYVALYADEAVPYREIVKVLNIANKGLVLSRNQILDDVWGYDCDVIDRTIDAYIRNIRKKLRLDCITTVKGIGYKFEMGQEI